MTRWPHIVVCMGGITSLTLTFFHPALWAAVGLFLGVATILIILQAAHGRLFEPAGFFFALLWIATTALMAVAWGFTQELFNLRQVALMLAGLLFGYFLSLARAPAWAAWGPFAVLALYFTALALSGRDPAEAFSRNSQNYVSVILLALYVSAVLLTRPSRVRAAHVLAAALVLTLSIWAAGRAGILASLLLSGALFVRLILQGRMGVLRSALAVLVLSAATAGILVGADVLQSQGYLTRFAGRGLHDASRISIILSYFDGIEVSELLFGKNYYHDSFMARWGFNLHNSYLEAWAHLGLNYLIFILAVLAISVRRIGRQPVLGIAVLAFAARALTDAQMLSGQYDYIIFATLFVLLRERSPRSFSAAPATSPS